MSILNVQTELPQDDEDTFGEVEARPLLGWFLMAVALVAMAFLIGGRGEVATASQNVTASPQHATAVAALTGAASAAGMAFGG